MERQLALATEEFTTTLSQLEETTGFESAAYQSRIAYIEQQLHEYKKKMQHVNILLDEKVREFEEEHVRTEIYFPLL